MAEHAVLLNQAPSVVASLIERARVAERTGRYTEAREYYQAAFGHLEGPEHAGIASSLFRWIGDIYRHEGDTAAALDSYLVCQTVAELNQDSLNLAHVLNCRGILEWQWGNLDRAADFYAQARRVGTDLGETHLLAMVEQNTGVLSNIRGDLVGALRHYRRSLAGYRKLGDRKHIGAVMSNIGMLHTDLGQWDKALATFQEAADFCDQVGDLRIRLLVEVNRTEVYILMGDYEKASSICDGAYVLAQELDHHLGLGDVHKYYGIIYRQKGQLGVAETHLREASQIGKRCSHPLLMGEVQRELAEVYRLQDRNGEALQALNAAHRIFSDLQATTEVADVSPRLSELESIFLDVVRRWGESIESKDRYTAGHCERVAEFSCRLAERMGFEPRTLTWFRMGALLHDVGKTMVPAEILNKRGKLSAFEWEIMRRHPLAGVELLSHIEFPWDIRPMIRSHHEKWDGTGYPEGLAGEQIPLAARILCVADVFDALTTTRSYRGAYTPEEALEIMQADSGVMFDPEPLRLFRELIPELTEPASVEPEPIEPRPRPEPLSQIRA